MPFMNDLQNVRMRNIFGSSGPNNRSAYAPPLKPSFEEIQMVKAAIRQEQEERQKRQFLQKFKYDEIANINEHNRLVDSTPRLQQIAQSVVEPQMKPPMNYVFKDSISPYQQAQLAARDKDRESRENIAGGKLEQAGTKITDAAQKTKNAEADRERRTKILESKDKKDLSEKETIELNALNRMKQIETQQKGMGARQEDAQVFTTGRDVTTQESALARIKANAANTDRQIGLRGDESRATNAASAADKRDNPESSFQQKTAIQIRMNRFIRENPEFQDKIKLDDDGYPDLSEIEDPDERERINLALGNKRTKDIKLPGNSSTTRPDPLGIRQ